MKVKYSNKAKAIRNLRDSALMRMDSESVAKYQSALDRELRKIKERKGNDR